MATVIELVDAESRAGANGIPSQTSEYRFDVFVVLPDRRRCRHISAPLPSSLSIVNALQFTITSHAENAWLPISRQIFAVRARPKSFSWCQKHAGTSLSEFGTGMTKCAPGDSTMEFACLLDVGR